MTDDENSGVFVSRYTHYTQQNAVFSPAAWLIGSDASNVSTSFGLL
jgi:hypothetical protein